jgi:hypothetical protein
MSTNNFCISIDDYGLGTIEQLYDFHANGLLKKWKRVLENYPENAWSLKGYGYAYDYDAIVKYHKRNISTKPLRILDVGGGYSTIGKLIVEDFGAEYWIIDDFGVESSEPIWSRYGSREELRKSNQ